MYQLITRFAHSCSSRLAETVRSLRACEKLMRVMTGRTVNNGKMGYAALPAAAARLPETIHGDNVMSGLWKLSFKQMSLAVVILLSLSMNAVAITPPGTSIDNTATAIFDFSGAASSTSSNPANIVTTIIQTPSTVSLFQYDATGTSAYSVPVPSQYATSGPPGSGFVASPDPVVPVVNDAPLTLVATDPQPLNPVQAYSSGEPVFVQVEDLDQNLDPGVLETVVVVITSSTGDQEEIILTETGLDTGVFVGFIQSTSASVSQYDGSISLGADSTVSVSYTDQYDPSDTTTGDSLVDPFGIVFSSLDGTLLDGAVVTILDDSGNPAQVYGDDGVSSFDNPVIAGGSVTDSSGAVYDFPEGAYRFPRLLPGTYSMQVTPPSGYQGPSTAIIADLQALPGAPYSLDESASFAGEFTLVPGPPLHVDIPLDALTSYLVIEKTASKDEVAVGDFVQYTLTLTNIDSNTTANGVVITDTLPLGLRYQGGSARYDGIVGIEPVISEDARKLEFPIASLPPGASTRVTYVTEVTVGTRLGKAVNSVIAEDNRGTRSNTALASILVTEDLFTSRSFIAGRVIVGECDPDSTLINPGLPSVRVFMEDGTYAATDEQGRFHFEGVKPGVHVVQVDKASIPDNLEIIECVRNSRFAGTPYSQFVDVQGGTLWRTDFYVREKQPITDTATLFIQTELADENIKFTIEMSNGEIPVKNFRLILNLPDGIEYDLGSSVLDGLAIEDPYVNENVIVYRLGDLGSNWNKELKLRGRIKQRADGDLVTSGFIILDTDARKNIRSAPIKNKLHVSRAREQGREVVYQAYFEPMGTELSYLSKRGIKAAIEKLGEVDITRNEITGYSDDRPVNPRSAWLYSNNKEISEQRARVVKEFLINDLKLDESTIITRGVGSSNPVASNATLQGRSKNRRAELVVSTSEVVGPGNVELITSESEVSEVVLEGQPEFKIEKLIEQPPITEQQDISVFDEFWIKEQAPGYEWLTPDVNYSPAAPSVNIAIKHKPSDKFEMLYNGERINPLFYFGMIKNKANTVARSYWQGVHLDNGKNRFDFIVRDTQGKIIKQLSREITFSGNPVRAEIAEEFSRLVADGRNVPVVAIRVYDEHGNYARPGSRGSFIISEPYLSLKEVEAFQTNRLSGLQREDPEYVVGQNGIAYILLEPTTETGKLELELPFPGRKKSLIQTWMQPELRDDWILVGLAEGTVGYNTVTGNVESLGAADNEEDFYDEGKVAFYAKGKVKGEWLLTTAYDTSKEQGYGDNRVDQIIDPNTYYTIYGDNSAQRYDASSAEKLYIKIERQQFYALFGDMSTGLSVTDLSRFERRMTGLKSEYDDGRYAYTAFAAENLNNFIKDEIQGEGISGLYRLSGNDIVINSDEIVIETRDRFRSEIIIESRAMRRYLDYNIDYSDGTIFFREPIPSRDENFNPVFIVADYEVESPEKGNITAGGRGSVKFNEDRVEVGVSVVHDGSYLNEGDLVGADARVEIDDSTEARLEIATTDAESEDGDRSGNAYRAEIVHGGDDLKLRGYAQQQGVDFGLGQQSVSQSGTRKYGVEADYRFNRDTAIGGVIYHEDILSTGSARDVAEANVIYNKRSYTLNSGARIARDDNGQGAINQSNLLLLGASKKLLGDKLNLRANAEIAVASKDDNIDYPSRYIIGADYFITPKVNLFSENEWTIGSQQDTQMARAGVRATPWANAQVNSAVNQETNENGIRSFATMGLTQGFPINKRWSGDVAIDHSRTMRTPDAKPFNDNVPVAQGTADNDFTAVSFGTTYNAPSYTLNNRLEFRKAEQEDKTGVIVNWERNLRGGIGYSATTKMFRTDRKDNSELLDGDIRFSLAYRPLQSRWIMLNRLDFKFDANTDVLGYKTRQRKLIDNFASNWLVDDRNQVSFNAGLKYVIDNFDELEYSGTTAMLGTEYRHDLNDTFDVGVHAHTLHSFNSNVYSYSTGVSFGWNMVRNIWLSIGYNFEGFEDSDFSAAGYTATGPYIRFRMKFDQDTVADLKGWMN